MRRAQPNPPACCQMQSYLPGRLHTDSLSGPKRRLFKIFFVQHDKATELMSYQATNHVVLCLAGPVCVPANRNIFDVQNLLILLKSFEQHDQKWLEKLSNKAYAGFSKSCICCVQQVAFSQFCAHSWNWFLVSLLPDWAVIL